MDGIGDTCFVSAKIAFSNTLFVSQILENAENNPKQK